MSVTTMDLLKQRIASSFADVPLPDARDLGHGPEAPALISAFAGNPWTALSFDDVWQHNVTELTPASLHHYLPAYLFAALDDYMDVLTLTVDALSPGEVADEIWRKAGLSPPTAEQRAGLRQARREREAVFTTAQREAITEFLEYVRNDPQLSQQFLPGELDAAITHWRVPVVG